MMPRTSKKPSWLPIVIALIGCFTFAALPEARAAGLELDLAVLPIKERGLLEKGIQQAQARHPQVFAQVSRAPAMAHAADRRKRGRMASIRPRKLIRR